MTYSIVARDESGEIGVATASKFLAIGATVPAVTAGVGAVASQGHTNPALRADGLDLLRDGATATEALERLTASDPGQGRRQVAVVAAVGPGAARTGPLCSGPAGHLVGDGWAVIGNLLGRAEVLDAMRDTFLAGTGPLAHRLVDSLGAGEAAGGDRRGRQSAALLVHGPGDPTTLRAARRTDLRVDDHPRPVDELRRLLERHDVLVTGPDPAVALRLEGGPAHDVDVLLQRIGLVTGPLAERLAAWAHQENLEHRLMDGRVDPVLVAELRRAAGAAAVRTS